MSDVTITASPSTGNDKPVSRRDLARQLRSQGLTYKEIGLHLGVTKGAAHSLTFESSVSLPKVPRRKQGTPKGKCAAPRCEREEKTRGMCMKHYMRFLRYGNINDIRNTGSLIDRFHRSYYCDLVTGCWVWTARTTLKGYGILSVGERDHARAHRFSYEEFKGSIPKGKMALHHCDNPPCCNPEHLYVGTAKDNARDCAERKSRDTFRRVTSPEQVKAIIDTYAFTGSYGETARILNLNYDAVRKYARLHRENNGLLA